MGRTKGTTKTRKLANESSKIEQSNVNVCGKRTRSSGETKKLTVLPVAKSAKFNEKLNEKGNSKANGSSKSVWR